ncbi:MAG: MFS transporter [Pseudomonadota bacterium]
MAKIDRPLAFILITLMLDAIGIGIVFPIMPDLMARVGAGDLAQGSLWAGLLAAAYATAQFVFAPIVGSLSDAYGRRPVLLCALFFLALDYVVMALADTYWLLMIGRVLAGVAGATYVTATAYVADITPREDRAARFGLLGAAFGIGFVLGPVIGGLAGSISVAAPFWVAAGLSAASFAFGLLILPESLKRENRRPFGNRDLNPFAIIFEAFRIPSLVLPLILIALFELMQLSYATIWSFWGKETFGWSTFTVGVTLSVYGILLALAQAVVMPFAVRFLGEERLVSVGLIVSLVAAVGFGVAQTVWLVALLLPIAALGDLVPPTLTAIAANVTDEDRQGMLQGVIASLSSVTAVIAPIIYAPVFNAFAGEDAIIWLPGAPFLLAALMILVMIALRWRVPRL